MAQLKSLVVTGNSNFQGEVRINNVNIKEEIDDSLKYNDYGYYKKPSSYTVVSEMPTEEVESDCIYFVCKDYINKTINTSVSCNGFNGTTYSHITNNLYKSNGDLVTSWQNTATSTAGDTEYTNWSVDAPKYGVKVACTPVFTDTSGDNLYIYGALSLTQNGYLREEAYVDEENITSGTEYFFYDSEYDNDLFDLAYLNPGFTYTIGTHSGLACLTGDTEIKVSKASSKKISEIEIGDTILDAKGKKTKVTKVFKHNVMLLFNIELVNGEIIHASAGHKFYFNKAFRRACQIFDTDKLLRDDDSTFEVKSVERVKQETEVFEILTESGTYCLSNGIINECEDI